MESSTNGRRARQRAFCIGAGPHEADLTELKELLRTAGVAVAGELTQRRPEPDPDRYLGKGKLTELKQAIKEADANLVAVDDGGDLWHRRMEELDAAVCALCAHRYAVGHASWLGDPEEGVVVLPGASIPSEFTRQGVMPPVERLHLSRA